LENTFKTNENVEEIDSDHYKITNRNGATHYYKTQFKKMKKFNKIQIPQESGVQ